MIRSYSPAIDFKRVFDLWHRCLGQTWPITGASLKLILTGQPDYRNGDHFVSERDGILLGFVATQVRRSSAPLSPQGGIALVMVHPEHRRQGIGSDLHDRALDHLRKSGIKHARLGAGTSARFWNGVPSDLPEALAFYRRRGWDFTETSYDLTRSLHDYTTPPYVYERIATSGITLGASSPGDASALLAFESREFPNWLPYFQETVEAEAYEDIITAWDEKGELVGTLLTFTCRTPGAECDRLWTSLLGEDMGGLGAVGVSETMRGQGIGLALVAKATDLLRERGVGNCQIGWTWLLDFYGRLGYRTWRTFEMSRMDL